MLVRFSKTGKNNRFVYMMTNFCRQAIPRSLYARRLRNALDQIEKRDDREYILRRVEYYNRLDAVTPLPDEAPCTRNLRFQDSPSAYYFDTMEYLRWFDRDLKWTYLFGDITHVPPYPAILKSRPIAGDNRNSVLLNLDKARHFNFIRDDRPFGAKADKSIFRGHIKNKPHRIRFMEMFYGSSVCDAGIVYATKGFPQEWVCRPISLKAHLRYKFIMALEGNDVASNLKWIMSSNSIAVMPRPTYETWYMEGTLIPNHHYIEIKSDFSDLEERLNYYIEHPDEAEKIIRNANDYTRQFGDRKREKLISLLVLEKYFRMTGQLNF